MARLFAIVACICASAAGADEVTGVPCPGLMAEAQQLVVAEMSRSIEGMGAATAHKMASQMLAHCEARNSPPQPGVDACAEERESARATAELLASVRAAAAKRRVALATAMQERMRGCRSEP